MSADDGHLFSAGNVGHLFLAQSLAFQIKQNGGKCYLLHNTNKDSRQTEYFAAAFRKLIAEDLWEKIWYVNDGGAYSYSSVWPKVINPFRSLRILAQTEQELKKKVEEIPNLGHLYVFHLNSPKTNFLASLAMDHRIKLHAIENGYATNMSSPYKADLIDYDKPLISRIRRQLSKFFLYLLGFTPWVLLRHPFVIHPSIKLNSLYALEPEKFPHQHAEMQMKPLGEVISDDAIQFLVNDLKEKELGVTDNEHNSCVFLTRPDDVDKFLTSEDFDEITEIILLKLLTRYDKVYIKPHPREKPSRYKDIIQKFEGVELLECDYQVPIELIAMMSNVTNWYGTWSYALLTLKKLCGLEAHALLPIYLNALKKQGKDTRKYQKVLDENFAMYPEDVNWVASINEINPGVGK